MFFHLISLGCPKNLCDSERIAAPLIQQGWKPTNDPKKAQVIVINTCAFIQSAIEESLSVIHEMLKVKKNQPKALKPTIVVAGCLPHRQGTQPLLAKLRKMGVDQFIDFPKSPTNDQEMICKLTPPWTAYVKIAEGCDNRCTYCTIPDIRGAFTPRPQAEIIKETRRLVANGAKEIILIAQDSTRYPGLPGLLKKLCKIEKLKWLRVMYLHPARISGEIIKTLASEPKIVKYLDLPIQHASDKILTLMHRRVSREQIESLINKIRREIPNVALRTTLIVGFPGETEADFNKLVSFVKNTKFERLGVFKYSREKGTPAAKLTQAVPDRVKQERFEVLMRLQRQVSRSNNQRMVGKIMEILIERESKTGFWGRTYMDAPQIDGAVHVNTKKTLQLGSIVRGRIIRASSYDLFATLL